VHVEPSHRLHDISIFKIVVHRFWHGLMVRLVIWGHDGMNSSFETFQTIRTLLNCHPLIDDC
jgi:hypothetical protein